MKYLFFALVTSLCITQTAAAVFEPGMHRPVYLADLTVTEASGTFQTEEHLQLVKYSVDGSKEAGFNLIRDENAPVKLNIVSVADAGCGSIRIEAHGFADGAQLELIVIDHTNRVCRDVVPGLLEISLTSFSPDSNSVFGTLEAHGNYEYLYSIQ